MQQAGKILKILMLSIFTIIIIVMAIFIGLNSKQKFQYKTYINGIECSLLNIKDATRKLEKNINNSEITMIFADNKKYTCIGTFFEAKVEKSELENILQKQSDTETKEYYIENLYNINEKKLKEYLSSLAVFNENNIRKSQNAYLDFDENNLLVVKPEIYGNEVNLEEACKFMIEKLKKGETVIDFTSITSIAPKILSDDKKLNEQKDYLNSILETTITYKLSNGEKLTLDATKMKKWITKNKDGYYDIDIDNNVANFVEELNEKASYRLTSTKFKATGKGVISISFGRKVYATVNTEKETSRIKETLGTKKVVEYEPTYNAIPNYLNIKNYVEIDLSRQKVWLYVNGKKIVDTSCVTGSVAGGYATPPGIFYLTYKTTDTYLEGYNGDGSKYKSHVNFWMPFNGGIGLHDALWRSNFGGNIYMTNGSHGCVNLPYAAAKTIYNNINTSIPIILYN